MPLEGLGKLKNAVPSGIEPTVANTHYKHRGTQCNYFCTGVLHNFKHFSNYETLLVPQHPLKTRSCTQLDPVRHNDGYIHNVKNRCWTASVV
jgi:hypothetical protein